MVFSFDNVFIDDKIIYGIITNEATRFDKIILEEYPLSVGIEYIIIFNEEDYASAVHYRSPERDESIIGSAGRTLI